MARTKEKRKTAVAYIRMSTEKQGASPDTQRDFITRWAAGEGVSVLSFHEDLALSGTLTPKRRPGLMEALGAIEAHGAAALLVYDDSRLARSSNNAGWVETELEELGAVLVDVSKPNGVSTIEKAIHRWQNEEYIHELRRRTKDALTHKSRNGERVSGQLPYGSQLAADGIHLEPCQHEQDALKRMRELRASGMGGRRIAAALVAEGFKPRGASWHPISVQHMADAALELAG